MRCISSHLSLGQTKSLSEFWKTKVDAEVTEADEAHRNMWRVTEQKL